MTQSNAFRHEEQQRRTVDTMQKWIQSIKDYIDEAEKWILDVIDDSKN